MNHNELVAACNHTFGSLSGFLIRYCGFRIPEGVGSHGREVHLVCPNHESEKNSRGGNCSANDEKAVFTCYTCCAAGQKATGSYVDAVMLYLHMDKKEAFQWLCEKCGIQNQASTKPSVASIRRRYVEVCHELTWAARGKERFADEAFQYLHMRGFNDRTIRSYRIGRGAQSPKGAAIQELLRSGLSQDDLLRAGVLSRSKKGNIYSPFMNRVICMAGGNIYGRSLLPKESEKLPHLYSRGENAIFNSGAIAQGLDVIFVVESIFDVLTVQQYISATSMHWGCIGTLGTHGVPEPEIAKFLVEKSPKEVIIIPDCDPWMRNGHRHAAGQMAGIKRAKVFEDAGLAVRVLNLPKEGMDANNLGQLGFTSEQFLSLVNRALPPILYRVGCTSKYYNLQNSGGRQGFLNAVKSELKDSCDGIPADVTHFVHQLTKLPEEEVKDFLDSSIKIGLAREAVKFYLARGLSPEEIIKKLAS